jgi:hypothetical protein
MQLSWAQTFIPGNECLFVYKKMEEGRELCNWYLLDIAVTVIKSGK